jgi:hypothetical protein
MSAIASFYLLDTSKLDELIQHAEVIVRKTFFRKKVIDNYWDYLTNNTSELGDFDASGYIYSNLFVYLQEEKNIDLLTNEYDNMEKELDDKRGCAHFLFTHHQKETFLTQIDPRLYSLADLQKFNQDFSEDGDEETAALTLDAIRVLHNNLDKIRNDRQVLLLIVG